MQPIHSGLLVFVGPGPFPCCFCVGPFSDETQIWLGDLRVVAWCFLVFWFLIGCFSALVDCCSYMATVLCTFLAFTSSTSVRTEPQATSATPGEKKKASFVASRLYFFCSIPGLGNIRPLVITFKVCRSSLKVPSKARSPLKIPS